MRDGARPAVDACSLTGNGEYGLRLQDAGGTYNGNVVAANAKGSVAYTLLDDEARGWGCGALSSSGVFRLPRLRHAPALRCAAPSRWPGPPICRTPLAALVYQRLKRVLAGQRRSSSNSRQPAVLPAGAQTPLLQVDTALMVVYNKLDRPVQSVGKI